MSDGDSMIHSLSDSNGGNFAKFQQGWKIIKNFLTKASRIWDWVTEWLRPQELKIYARVKPKYEMWCFEEISFVAWREIHG